MSKPSIENIITSQTFQNWFDKTNDLVDIMRDSAVTASSGGDDTTGDANLAGEFTANTVSATDNARIDFVEAFTAGQPVTFTSPTNVIGTTTPIATTFTYGASGARTRYTDTVNSWDIGFDNSTNANFQMNQGSGGQFSLSPDGVLTVPSVVIDTDITVDTINTNQLVANNATFNTAAGVFSGTFIGNFTGDVYKPDGTTKIFENGGPGVNIPATFTGNVNGTVSSLTNHNTGGLTEGTNLYYTNERAHAAITGGTGVSVTAGVVAIGQSVGTTANVTFGSGGTAVAVSAKGQIVATGDITAFGSVSDRTQKENIKPITNALNKVEQLGGYTFNYKNKSDTPMTGVMAQELLEVLPEAVYKTIDGNTGEEIYAVRHGNIIGLIIEAIKELNEKVGK